MKRVDLTDLQADLGRHVRAAQAGRTLVVCEQGRPVAILSPYPGEAPVAVRAATRRPRDLRLPPRPAVPTDSSAVLREDRARR